MSQQPEPIIVVTGFPRSGTSLLMQMLASAGIPVLHDEERQADPSNPRGYYELEVVKRIARDTSWLGESRGRAVKIVTPLLTHLPASEAYRVIMVHRDWEEIMASQRTMRQRTDPQFSIKPAMKGALINTFQKQENRALEYLARMPEAGVYHLQHGDLIQSAAAQAPGLADFLGCAMDPEAFAKPVDPDLYRNRGH